MKLVILIVLLVIVWTLPQVAFMLGVFALLILAWEKLGAN